MKGMYSTQEELPFWMYHNKRGRISENTNVAGWISGKAVHDIKDNTSLEFGGGLLYQNGVSKQVFIDEIYAQFKNPWFGLTAGIKQQKEYYNGLSASNQSISWSLNARPMPGVCLSISSPTYIFPEDGIGFEASWGEYLMGQDRAVSYARVHQKSFYLVYRPTEVFQIKAGLKHTALWGGATSNLGGREENFNYYLNVITAGSLGRDRSGEEDQGNALRKNMGSYELYISKTFRKFKAELIYNHIFENGSGSKFDNAPDGRYGIYLESKDPDRIVSSFIYEFYYTKQRSQSPEFDNYFNGGVYGSGWTHLDRGLGVPFFTEDPNGEGILRNAFSAHHIGISGQFSDYFNTFPYKLMLSTVQYQAEAGKFGKQSVFYGDFEMRVLQSFVDLSFNLSAEFNSLKSPGFGIGLKLRKKLF